MFRAKKRLSGQPGGITAIPMTDKTQKALAEWKRLQALEDKGRLYSQAQMKEEKGKETHLLKTLRQLSRIRGFHWHGVPKIPPLHDKYQVQEFEYERPKTLNALILENRKDCGVAAAYLIKRAAKELYVPCNVETFYEVSGFVAAIMRGVKDKPEQEFNLLFIPMELPHVFGPNLMRSLFEYGMEIPVVLCTAEPPGNVKQQVLDSAHLRRALDRDELESRTSKARRKPWTSLPLPFTKDKLLMLVASWWAPTQNRLKKHRERKAKEKSSKVQDPWGRPKRIKTPVELAMEPGKQPPKAHELMKRSASYVMRYPLINGLGVNGTIRTYSSRQYDLAGSMAPKLKETWEKEMEDKLQAFPGELEKLKALGKRRLKVPAASKKMMHYLMKSKKKTQEMHTERLRVKSFGKQAKQIGKFLPCYSAHNQAASVGLPYRKTVRKAIKTEYTPQMSKMKSVNNACGYHPVHPLKGYCQSWDFQYDKGADPAKKVDF